MAGKQVQILGVSLDLAAASAQALDTLQSVQDDPEASPATKVAAARAVLAVALDVQKSADLRPQSASEIDMGTLDALIDQQRQQMTPETQQ